MAIKKILSVLGEDLIKVEESIKENFISNVALIPEISEYLTSGGGKRLRPILLLLISRLCGGDKNRSEKHIRYSCVMEYIHAATLLHDDVIDEAHTRRGKTSANVKWGNEASVLVGDYLFSKSFDLVAIDSEPRVTRTISRATTDLAEGEVKELMLVSKINVDEKDYLDVIDRKTASLIAAACKVGAILADASDDEADLLYSFGQNIGMAFQLVDDIFDYTSNEAVLGKPVGNDLKEGKITLPLIYAYRVADEYKRGEIERIIHAKAVTDSELKWIVDVVMSEGGVKYTTETAKKYIEKAKQNLEIFSSSEYYPLICNLADYVISRVN